MDEGTTQEVERKMTYPRIITRSQFSECKYNTKLTVPGNHEVAVISKKGIRRIKKIEKPILNRKFFVLFRRRDPNIYVVFYLNKAIFEGMWKGKISFSKEKIQLIANYSFSIIRGDKFVLYIAEVKDTYTSEYVMEKINKKIGALIKQCIYQHLAKNTLDKLEKDLYKVSKLIQKRLNKEVLAVMGIRLMNFDVSFEMMDHEENSSKGKK